MKKLIVFIILIAIVFTSFILINITEKSEAAKAAETNHAATDKLESEVTAVRKLLKGNSKYNSEIGFFIDMGIASGKNRFFIYDFNTEKVIDKGLVAHGSGSETGIEGKLQFSNINNSRSTSLGKYSIGNSYYGKFGKAYKLYGLDKTNSNAFERYIVLHKYFDVPYEEQPGSICNSLGCPMVNEKFYSRIEKIIDGSEKSIILNIYY